MAASTRPSTDPEDLAGIQLKFRWQGARNPKGEPQLAAETPGARPKQLCVTIQIVA